MQQENDPPGGADPSVAALVGENQALLRLLCEEIGDLGRDRYAAEIDGFEGMTVGRHCRHVGEHYDALLLAFDAPAASDTGLPVVEHKGRRESFAMARRVLDYDRRQRSLRFETCPDFAIERLTSSAQRLEALRRRALATPLEMRCIVDPASVEVLATPTTLGRELAFLVSHTVHHGAVIALLIGRCGRMPDPRLWIAASTRAAGSPAT